MPSTIINILSILSHLPLNFFLNIYLNANPRYQIFSFFSCKYFNIHLYLIRMFPSIIIIEIF